MYAVFIQYTGGMCIIGVGDIFQNILRYICFWIACALNRNWIKDYYVYHSTTYIPN